MIQRAFTFKLSEAEYVEGEKILRFLLTESIFLRNLGFVALLSAAAGVTVYLRDGISMWAYALCLGSCYLLWERFIQSSRRALNACVERPQLLGPFDVVIDRAGLSCKSEFDVIKLDWQEVSRYAETPDIFVIRMQTGKSVVIPKRLFTDQNAGVPNLIRELAKGKGWVERQHVAFIKRDLIVRAALGVVMAAWTGGILQHYTTFAPTRRLHRRPASARESEIATAAELHGRGKVLAVPLDGPQAVLSANLLDYYRDTYGLKIQVLEPVPIPPWAKDRMRDQVIAEELVEAIKQAYPAYADDADVTMIGITDQDMYISAYDWEEAFSWRNEGRFAVISTANLSDERFRKVMTKDIGILHYHLQLSDNPESVLYGDIGDTRDLDDMRENYSRADADTHTDVFVDFGDPCFTLRHYFDPELARTDSLAFSGCHSFDRRHDLEIMDVDLRYGFFMDRRTEFYFPDTIPLQFTRVVRTQDSRARAFGIGGSHTLNIFPVGDAARFSWIDLLLADGARIHYKRFSPGSSYWDAQYGESGGSGTEFADSTISWASPGWKLKIPGGRTYLFPEGSGAQRPEQAALIGIQDETAELTLKRDGAGNLLAAASPSGFQLKFGYDGQNRIRQIRAGDDAGFDYRYDSDGRLAEASGGGQVMEYRYEGDKGLSILQNGGLILHNDFDEGGRVIRMALPSGRTYRFRYTFGSDGQINAVDAHDSAGPSMTFRMLDPSRHTIEIVRKASP